MGLVFLLWICAAAVCDALYRKFFNWLAIFGGLAALVSLLIYPKLHPVSISALDGFLGGFLAFIVLIGFYIFKIMGAGDVKFSALLGLWLGWDLLLPIWALSCAFAVLHGLIARSDLKHFYAPAMKWSDKSQGRGGRFIPYVTYLSIATVIVLIINK